MNQRSNGFLAETIPLDDTNRRLLTELQANARLTVAELGRRVGLSSPAVAERLQRLESQGAIRGYHASVDPAALGYPLSAIIRVRPAPRQIHKVADLVRGMPEVVECHRITGEDCYLVKAHVRSVTHLEEIIDQLVAFGQTTTSIIQSSPVHPRAIEPARPDSGTVRQDLVDRGPAGHEAEPRRAQV
jgi:Lrp/AsnC family transcriptional regulator, leucine-responsive regulatory protein